MCIVAPYVGAWIETNIVAAVIPYFFKVAPYVGAWIETKCRVCVLELLQSRTLCGCVD